ncbi:MAG: cytochrome c peroxidase [Planctomycetota bacterium]
MRPQRPEPPALPRRRPARAILVAMACALFPVVAALAQLPPMPVPPENPLTPEKAILGKILFWEEQVSGDSSVACGTCHIPGAGGSDPRVAGANSIHPGLDGVFATEDDVVGSIGVVRQDCSGALIDDGVFFPERQVTGRRTPSFIGAGFAPDTFWDGRATGEFRDEIVIVAGGALESQAVGPIMSEVEMGCEGRTWDDVKLKLLAAVPLALATNLPLDISDALVVNPTYPDLFNAAFGSPEITAGRIGMAIASYERTLLPDSTPFDLHDQGVPGALTPDQIAGLNLFDEHCSVCHAGIELTDNDFHNIGVRPIAEDIGRQEVTGDPADAGKFKTPPLRNVKLRAPFFHNGGKPDLDEVLAFYNGGGDFAENLDPEMVELNLPNTDLLLIKDFLEGGLTDPRVEFELPPFDRPTLQPFFRRGDANLDDVFDLGDAITTLEFLFTGGSPLDCEDAADGNDDGVLDLGDPITMLNRLFAGAPPLPLPSDISHGPDPTPDALICLP